MMDKSKECPEHKNVYIKSSVMYKSVSGMRCSICGKKIEELKEEEENK